MLFSAASPKNPFGDGACLPCAKLLRPFGPFADGVGSVVAVKAGPRYNSEVNGYCCSPVGELGLLVHEMSVPSVPSSTMGLIGCEPEVQLATATVFYLRNRKKQRNFIMADLTAMGYFHFYVENLPKDKTGCPGWWLFEVAWNYFERDQQVSIKGVRGDWTSGDNLDTVNRLTAGGQLSLEDAAKQTWTFQQAMRKGFARYQSIDAQGSPGQYSSVDVVFLP